MSSGARQARLMKYRILGLVVFAACFPFPHGIRLPLRESLLSDLVTPTAASTPQKPPGSGSDITNIAASVAVNATLLITPQRPQARPRSHRIIPGTGSRVQTSNLGLWPHNSLVQAREMLRLGAAQASTHVGLIFLLLVGVMCLCAGLTAQNGELIKDYDDTDPDALALRLRRCVQKYPLGGGRRTMTKFGGGVKDRYIAILPGEDDSSGSSSQAFVMDRNDSARTTEKWKDCKLAWWDSENSFKRHDVCKGHLYLKTVESTEGGLMEQYDYREVEISYIDRVAEGKYDTKKLIFLFPTPDDAEAWAADFSKFLEQIWPEGRGSEEQCPEDRRADHAAASFSLSSWSLRQTA